MAAVKILVGCTGLVGKNLLEQTDFDFLYSSKNMDNSFPDGCDLYLACLPATKWMINQSTESKILDCINCLNIIDILSKKRYNKVVLISTIDVYLNSEAGSDEDKLIDNDGIGYGQNRLLFEKLVQKELQYNSLKIYRLPALFGDGLKKNVLFDLINSNNIKHINKNSYYQWYNLDRLWDDINSYEKQEGFVVNLFTEPVFTKDIVDKYFDSSIGFMSDLPVIYNYKTKFSTSGYILSAEEVMSEIEGFIRANRS